MVRILCGLVPALLVALTQQASPPPQPAPQAETIGSRFKNIQVLTDLKDAPAPQLFEMMQFMAGSLSVSCNYCHVAQNGPFDSDENTVKAKARDMIRMVRQINATSFGDKQVVTCNTCHQGSPHPPAIPSPWNKTADAIAAYRAGIEARKAPPAVPPASATPTAAQILERYRAAVNGDAVKSMRATGQNIVAVTAANIPFSAEAQFPDRWRLTVDQGGPTQMIVNGARGWRHTGQGTTDLPLAQIAATRQNLDVFVRPLKVDTTVTNRTTAGIAAVDGVRCYVVESVAGTAIERLYFDIETGLLKKSRRETSTPLGTKVEERTFADYRAVSGVMLPFLMRGHYMEEQSELRLATVELNPAIDAAAFERPGGS